MSNKERVNIENRISNEELVAEIQAGENGSDNMLQLWQQNRGFVYKMARKYQGYAEMDDLMQEGYIGLCEAVRQYDPDKSVPFINYAAFWIRQIMKRYIDNFCGVVRIPVHVRENIIEYQRTVKEYMKYYGCEPSDRELCSLLYIDREKLHTIQQSARMGKIDSLNRVIGEEDEDITIADTVASGEDIEEDCIQKIDYKNMSRELWLAVDRLPEKQRTVIRLRYVEGKTMKDTGEVMGVTADAVRQIQAKALRMLRTNQRSVKITKYHEEYIAAASIHHVGIERFKCTWVSEVEREALKL